MKISKHYLQTIFGYYLEEEMHEHFESVLAGVFAGDVRGGQVEQVGAGFRAQRVDQHAFTHAARAGDQDRFNQRRILVHGRRA